MRLKLYRAANMAEVMAQVRFELGPDALILRTRRVADGVEMTVAVDPEAEERRPLPLVDDQPFDPFAFHGIPDVLADQLRPGPLEQTLTTALSFGQLPTASGDAPLLVAGPPGAGKTLTVARLATRLVLAGGAPMIITADGRRAGATEQLAAFTRLLGLNLVVATQPGTLGRALARRVNGEPVLIDTPGIDVFDRDQRDELCALAAAAHATVALVLPGGMDPAEAADIACDYAEAGATMLVATRLDLARRLGGVLTAAQAGRLSLTEAGTGPGASDGLVPMTPDFLAERLRHRRPTHPRTAPAGERVS